MEFCWSDAGADSGGGPVCPCIESMLADLPERGFGVLELGLDLGQGVLRAGVELGSEARLGLLDLVIGRLSDFGGVGLGPVADAFRLGFRAAEDLVRLLLNPRHGVKDVRPGCLCHVGSSRSGVYSLRDSIDRAGLVKRGGM
jgi:hypothetical protein